MIILGRTFDLNGGIEMRDLMGWDRASHLVGESVVDMHNQKIGKVEDLAQAWDRNTPEWLVVRTSFLGRRLRLVPIDGVEEQGETVHVPFSKESVLSAPVPEIPAVVFRSEREALARHYSRAA
jgi:sporulation protein YlmC with PRC-barrel domain